MSPKNNNGKRLIEGLRPASIDLCENCLFKDLAKEDEKPSPAKKTSRVPDRDRERGKALRNRGEKIVSLFVSRPVWQDQDAI